MSKNRGFTFTLNNYTEEEQHKLRALGERKTTTYMIFGREIGKEEKTPHLQGFVYFKNPRSFSGAKKAICKRAHIEVAGGTPAENKTYCSKDGDFEEFGTLPAQGQRNDLLAFVARVREGASDFELLDEFPVQFVRFGKSIDRVRLAQASKSVSFRKVEVLVFWGDAGCGKTKKAYEIDPDLYVLSEYDGRLWFDGYCGQETLLLDDFYGGIKYSFLLRLLDGHPVRLQTKGSHAQAQWTRVIITSNDPPESWYQRGLTPALERRLTTITHCETSEN